MTVKARSDTVTLIRVNDGTNGTPGAKGADGKTSYIHFAYANSADGSSEFSVSESAGKLYIGQYTDFTEADSTDPTKYAWTLIKGDPGAPGPKGDPGNGIRSVTVTYGVSSSAATHPTSWSGTVPSVAAGQYLWTRTIIDYTDSATADTVTYTYALQGKTGATGAKGDTGAAGTSVKVSSIQYQAGASAITAPTGTWSNAVVSAAEGQYLWTKTTFSDGTIAYGVSKQGAKGATGATGVGIKATVTQYYLSTSSTTPTGGTWSTTQPALVSGKYLWTRDHITWTTGATADTDPVLAAAINAANTTAATAKTEAASAKSTANGAKTTADAASSTATAAQSTANTAAQGVTDLADTTTAMQTQIEHNDNAIAETTTGIAKNAEDVQELYSQTNATNADLTDVITAQSVFSQTVDGLNASVTRLQGDVNDNAAALKPVTEWMRFDETGMAIGNSDSGRKVKINEQAVEFDNAAGEAVARFAEKAEIHDLEIADGGTFAMGNWAWIPRSNGNLSLKWIGGH